MPIASSQFDHRFFSSLDDAVQLLRLFDFIPNVFLYVKDLEGQFVGMNQQWMDMRDANSPDELLGKTDTDLHPMFWARQYQQEDRRVIDSGQELPDQLWLVPSGDGKLSTFISSKVPLRDREGSMIGIAGVMYRTGTGSESSGHSDPVTRASELIAAGYSQPLSIQNIAVEVGLSVSQLNRRFRAVYQIPPSEYLQRVRVYEAGRRLTDTTESIGAIALDTGFYDQAHLTRTFRQRMGMTPTEFRRNT